MKQTKQFFFILFIFLLGCTPQEQDSNTEEAQNTSDNTVAPEDTTEPEAEPEENTSNLLGYYVGVFYPVEFKEAYDIYHANKITISIDSLNAEDQTLYGHSIVAGNDRPFTGTYAPSDSGYVAQVKEPGDDNYDGAFNLLIKAEEEIVSGNWKAFKPELLSAPHTKFELKKREFAYDASVKLPDNISWTKLYDNSTNYGVPDGEFLTQDVLKLNASERVLSKEDIENMYKGDLEVIRNSIYARHGYSFKNRKMRFVFDHIEWYMPISTDIRDQLTSIEMQNIDLLKRYEQHSEKYYDIFGR